MALPRGSSLNDSISIRLNKRLGLRPVGKPINPEMSGAANPENYYKYKSYQKMENWINIYQKIALLDFINEEIDSTKFARDIKIDSSKYLLKGKFKIASCKIIKITDIECFNKDELSILRNEIFARYGYEFKSNKFKKYFNSKKWYKPILKNVKHLLTDIEKQNIKFIKNFEAKKH